MVSLAEGHVLVGRGGTLASRGHIYPILGRKKILFSITTLSVKTSVSSPLMGGSGKERIAG